MAGLLGREMSTDDRKQEFEARKEVSKETEKKGCNGFIRLRTVERV